MRAELLPLAHRLRREGHEVDALVWRSRYENAWGGNLQKIARHSDGTLNGDTLRPQVEAAAQGDLCVVTTVKRLAELFHAAPKLFALGTTEQQGTPDRLLFAGWFNGEAIEAPHLLVADWGVWPGGLGPEIMGGLTLIRLSEWKDHGEKINLFAKSHGFPHFLSGAIEAAIERMKSTSFRGLFHFDVLEVPATGELRLQNLFVGWPWLHTQCFVAELKSLSEVLGGAPPTLLHKFVSVLPVTVPPWPNEKRSEMDSGAVVEGLTVQQQGACFWFDITVDEKNRQLKTAGLDGLLCVATGASDSTPALARARALELAAKIQVPAKQHRWDAFGLVDSVLSTLEDRYSFVV